MTLTILWYSTSQGLLEFSMIRKHFSLKDKSNSVFAKTKTKFVKNLWTRCY